jgi:hypothetical protein
MATYLIKEDIDITRQEGDTADIVFDMPVLLDMGSYPVVKFQTKKTYGGTIILNKTVGSGLAVVGQVITVTLDSVDTKGANRGTFKWELEISNDTPEIITVGRGTFTVVKELIL